MTQSLTSPTPAPYPQRAMRRLRPIASGLLAGALVSGTVLSANACGGFFCSQAAPVNQAAERILFADNGDGTVTAVIQILYEGPSENFSWLLPISAVPQGDDIQVASDLAFARLQSATNPQYSLTTRVEGTCRSGDAIGGVLAPPAAANASAPSEPESQGGNGVTVAASGVVGAFEWTALALDPALTAPADAAVQWLTANGYDVSPGADALLGPYLEEGRYLLALRLTKGSDVGAIRPIVLTYPADLPDIPIKLTAVAANDDMGVMTWVAAQSRSVPVNYDALELNEARINWFNASSNYADVVNAAADEAGSGHGFVTEFAGASASLGNTVWFDFEDRQWQDFRAGTYRSFSEIFWAAYNQYASFDGFWEAIQASVVLPDNIPFQDFRSCPDCYANDVQLTPTTFFDALETQVIDPMRLMQRLIDGQEYVTRFYSTLSAAEMTEDPVFGYNADLGDVSNIHTAERIIECTPSVYEFEANWRIELPQGAVIRGTPQDVGTWPATTATQAANFRILRLSSSGDGEVLVDNAPAILAALPGSSGAAPTTPTMGSTTPATPGAGTPVPLPIAETDDGCSLSPRPQAPSSAPWLLAASGLAMVLRRRRAGGH